MIFDFFHYVVDGQCLAFFSHFFLLIIEKKVFESFGAD